MKSRSDQRVFRHGRKTKGSFPARPAALVLALIPLVILILNVVAYHVDIPFWDQWNFVPLLGQSYERGVSLTDLWSQHNEHRLLFPRLIMLGLARASGYNTGWELGVIILLAAAACALLSHQFFRTAGDLGASGFPWPVPIISLLIFTLSQAENWLWGWQIQIFLNVLAVIGGLVLLGGRPFHWNKLAGALGCGIVATYSFANGLLIWPLGFLGLLLIPREKGKQKKRALIVWTAASAAVAASYLYRFQYYSPSGTPWTQFLDHPGEYLRYLFIYLGRPVINYQEYALAMGVAGFFLFGFLCAYVFLKKRSSIHAVLPFLLTGLYAIGCGVLTGIGRVGFGSAQAMDGRYVPFSALLWISNCVLLFIFSEDMRKRTRSPLRRLLVSAGLALGILFLVFWVGRTSYRVGHRVFKSHHARLVAARQELIKGDDTESLLHLYNDAAYVRQGVEILKKHKLSVFR